MNNYLECIVKFQNGMEVGCREELVRCRDCRHRPIQTEPPETYGFSIVFPEGSKCPCCCEGDGYYSWYPDDDWFCPIGEKKDEVTI